MQNIRVLHVVNISFVLPYYIGDQFDYFSERGVDFYVACQPSEHFTRYCKEKKISRFNVNILREINVLEDIRAVNQLRKFIKREKIEIVIGHTPKGGLIGMLASYFAGVNRRVYFRHGVMFETSTGIKRFVLKTIERFTGHLAKQVVCVSPSVINFSNSERLSAAKKNILLNKGTCNGIDSINRFNRGGIDVERIEKLKFQYHIKSDDRVIGFVGRLVNDKGINELLQAWKIISERHKDVKLLLVGPFEERDSVSEEMKYYIENTESIIHPGLIHDISPFYALMDVFILPSYREGFPTVVLEASSMELPVLTTRVTGCRDSLVDNETGLFIDLNTIDIVEKIEFYLANPLIRIKHGVNGRRFVVENFDQKRIWKEIGLRILEIKNTN